MPTTAFSDLPILCRIKADNLAAKWSYAVEQVLMEPGIRPDSEEVFMRPGDNLDSVDSVQATVNAIWLLEVQSKFGIGPSPPEPPKVVLKNLENEAIANYQSLEHEIAIPPSSFPIARFAVLHEIAHAIVDNSPNAVLDWSEPLHGKTFIRTAFRLYRSSGLTGYKFSIESVVDLVDGLQQEEIQSHKCDWCVEL